MKIKTCLKYRKPEQQWDTIADYCCEDFAGFVNYNIRFGSWGGSMDLGSERDNIKLDEHGLDLLAKIEGGIFVKMSFCPFCGEKIEIKREDDKDKWITDSLEYWKSLGKENKCKSSNKLVNEAQERINIDEEYSVYALLNGCCLMDDNYEEVEAKKMSGEDVISLMSYLERSGYKLVYYDIINGFITLDYTKDLVNKR